ncbi:DUF2157 domain-containing protein [Demequina iriomotensis]|uniref:DUF2157 domain-containing protein n=1 Tax=Demequina iriomotensis TaxID=1536641 RepID=UPI000784DFC5|nr:DUF2157 domain-containing protein [Demequina iriomotensis]
MNELETRLDRWVEAGLISPETAADLRRFEAQDTGQAPPQARTLALVGEVLGYLGAALALSAVAFILGRTWDDLATAGRIAVVAALTLAVAFAGARAARLAAPSAQRLASVLLLATVALTGWLAWVVLHDAAGLADEPLARAVTGTMAVCAGIVYALRRRTLAQVALLAGLAAAVATVTTPWAEDDAGTSMGLAWAALGAGWLALAITPVLIPTGSALVSGGLLSLLGLQIAATGDLRGWLLGLAIVLGAWMVAAAVTRRTLLPLIVPGAVGLLIAVPQLIDHLVGDAIVTWLAVMVTGVALVVVALRMVRERRRPDPNPATDADDDILLSP